MQPASVRRAEASFGVAARVSNKSISPLNAIFDAIIFHLSSFEDSRVENGMTPRPEKWTLTKEALDVFLARLDADRDRAGESYEQVRRKLVTFFRCNGCWDAERLVDETIDRVIRRLGEVDVIDLMAFIRGVARHVASEAHKISIQVIALDDAAEPSRQRCADPEAEELTEKRLGGLEKCARYLSHQDRELVFDYYRYDKTEKIENKRKMAQNMGITAGALRVRAFRARQHLEDCITNCIATASA
jgi:DNA-directed RNA polymerase specialized sigma24 family protein